MVARYRTGLHWACSEGNPSAIIEILKIHPDHASLQDPSGWTPLHLVFSGRSSSNVCLLWVVPELIAAYTKALTMNDAQGYTPLHHAQNSRVALDVMILLLEAAPEALRMLPRESKPVLGRQDDTLTRKLVQRYPKIAANPFRRGKHKGKFIFECMLESGEFSWEREIIYVFEANPKALFHHHDERLWREHLIPYILARVSPSVKLETMYEFIRWQPHLFC